MPTTIPIRRSTPDIWYTKGIGSTKLASGEPNNLPPKKSYKELYPNIVISIGTIEPRIPINKPSIIKGIFIDTLEAPTNLIISISRFLE